jgi:hypothetical protein
VQKLSDWVLAAAIPVHMHISTNACVTDYVPTRFRGELRRGSRARGGLPRLKWGVIQSVGGTAC